MNKDTLLKKLDELGIKYSLYTHDPLQTTEQAKAITTKLGIPGAWVKNLFLKDSKKNVWLLVALADTKVELKKFGKEIGAPELRFADANMLMEYLGVIPGAVSPLTVINDKEHKVTVIMDASIFEHDLINVHPLTNEASITISPNDVKKFIELCGNKIIMHRF